MTSSIYTRTAYEIAKRALKLCRVVDAELPAEAQARENAFDALNGFIKFLQTKGFNLWRETEAMIPLVDGQESYLIGPNGDRAFNVDDFTSTSLNTAAVTSDVLIDLTSTDGLTASPNLLSDQVTNSTQDWLAVSGSVSADSSGLEVINVVGQAEASYSFNTEVGTEYKIRVAVLTGTGGGFNIEVGDFDGIITSQLVTTDITVTLSFTARQKETAISFENVNAVAAQSSTVETMTLIDTAKGDAIGFFLDDNSLFWTNILYSSPFEIHAGIPSDAAAGNLVYSYTELLPRALSVTNMRFRDRLTASDIPTTEWSRVRYFEQPDKSSKGTLTKWYYSPQLNDGRLYIWQPSRGFRNIAMFTYIRPVEVTDENSGHVDFPSEWYDLLAFGTADMLIAEYSVPDNVTMKITTKYAELLDGALGYDNQGFVDIEPDYEGRR